MAHDRRILIADDDLEVRLGAVELLESLDLSIVQAERGDDAWELARDSGPLDLALLDLQMPGFGGLELFALLRGEFPSLPCILWSGTASTAIEKSALAAGVAAFLHKPVRPEVLRGEVRRLLDTPPPRRAG